MTIENFVAKPHEPKESGVPVTNAVRNSVAWVQHSEPSLTLYGRIAAAPVGKIGQPHDDLHLSLIIDDAYSGIVVIDGQPTLLDAGIKNALLIQTNIYENTLPRGVVVKIPLNPPDGMSKQVFAQRLAKAALNFSSYVAAYSAPKGLTGALMKPGEYNSSSYLAGLLQSVMGYVPKLSTPGYQTPGWESPIPSHYFKGEALR